MGRAPSDRLPELYSDWDQWANEVADGHTRNSVLYQFRLPRARCHWLLTLVAALDGSLRPSVAAGEARLFLLSATACADDLAASLRISETLDHETVTEAEFAAAVSLLTDTGYPVERWSWEAWSVFRGRRDHYGTTTNRLLDTIAAPPACWSGSRGLPTKRHPA